MTAEWVFSQMQQSYILLWQCHHPLWHNKMMGVLHINHLQKVMEVVVNEREAV